MNLAHVHLLLNHFPTVGMIIAVGLLLIALIGKNDDLKRASLVVFLGLALITIPTYVAGNAAEEAVCVTRPNSPCEDPAVSKDLIEQHETAAFWGLGFMELTGVFAWLGLWQHRRTSRLPRWSVATVLLLSIFTFAVMARTANIGGGIRHPEIRSGPVDPPPAEKPLARRVGAFVKSGVPWMWPTCETLHFIGLSLLFGVAIILDLRVLGMIKSVPFAALHRLLPWGVLGFGLNVVTGMLFFVAASHQYTTNPVFLWKLGLILLAGINVLYFTIFDETWVLGPGDDAPLTAKVMAASAVVLVVGIIFCGQMLPFLGNSF